MNQVQRLLSKRAVPNLRQAVVATSVRYSSNIMTNKQYVPKEDYYEGHLMADHLEYIDDWLDHTVKIENTVKGLKATYDKKYQAYKTTPGATAELDALFHQAAAEKQELMKQLDELKTMMRKAQSNPYFAVDAPDGMPDAELVDDVAEVDRIIDYAAKHEEAATIERRHEMEKAVKK